LSDWLFVPCVQRIFCGAEGLTKAKEKRKRKSCQLYYRYSTQQTQGDVQLVSPHSHRIAIAAVTSPRYCRHRSDAFKAKWPSKDFWGMNNLLSASITDRPDSHMSY